MPDPRIVVVGAGPTGLGAAWRLSELGHTDWDLFEAGLHPGGLASSVIDDQGFTWDLGGHVLFSHYRYFDYLMTNALGDHWLDHVREAWVWIRERWIPYPIQNNIWRLPDDELMACLDGLVLRTVGTAHQPPASFHDWLLAGFGRGLCEIFMFPYNRKVWAYAPDRLGVGWVGERVATVDFSRVLRNLVLRRDDVSWGPNSTFRFPLRGGTGAIWQALNNLLPRNRTNFGREVTCVDPCTRRIGFADGGTTSFDYLISTMPLDRLLRILRPPCGLEKLADRFVHSASHIVGIGVAGRPPESLASKCWLYFPEDHVPFYRVTVFSNYSPNNVPQPGSQWSLMAEVSESAEKPVDQGSIVNDVIDGFRACRLLVDGCAIASRWHTRLEYGYPTPWQGRDEVLATAEATLRANGIFSRGRFGAWRYEVSNQDHSVMQGVEAVNHLLCGAAERTIRGDMSDEDPDHHP